MNFKNNLGKSFILSLCLTLVTGLIFTSCKKDDPLPTINVDLLTAAPWAYISAEPVGTAADAILKTVYDGLYTATTFTFNADGTLVWGDANVTYATGTWSLTSDKTGLILTLTGTSLSNTTVTVSTLSASSLIFVAKELAGGKTTYTLGV
ncbi:MAG: hypothetical protein OEW75_17205 [Cyclobacteriaceae bacterium]|nr:hypothetical protein [Cyclobacteriaceae bacterium]